MFSGISPEATSIGQASHVCLMWMQTLVGVGFPCTSYHVHLRQRTSSMYTCTMYMPTWYYIRSHETLWQFSARLQPRLGLKTGKHGRTVLTAILQSCSSAPPPWLRSISSCVGKYASSGGRKMMMSHVASDGGVGCQYE